MSDRGRYRKLYARLWFHAGFQALTDSERILAIYLLTGPQTNRLGLYTLSIARAAEDLGTLPQTLSKRLVRVCETFGWLFDKPSRVFYIPSWFRWNPPENVNVMKGSLNDLNEITPCALMDVFAHNIETLPETLRETFIEGLRQRIPKGLPNQEQYPDPYPYPDQKHETAHSRGSAGASRRSSLALTKTKNDEEDSSDEHRVAAAREVLKVTGRACPMEHLIDALGQVFKGPYTKSQARAAFNIALSELEQATA